MKIFLAILSIALVAQVSLGASLKRDKRDVDVNAVAKEWLTLSKSVFEKVAKEMPDTEAYAKYKSAFAELLELLEHEGEVVCFEQVMAVFAQIREMAHKGLSVKSEQGVHIQELLRIHTSEEYLNANTNIRELLYEKKLDALEHCETE